MKNEELDLSSFEVFELPSLVSINEEVVKDDTCVIRVLGNVFDVLNDLKKDLKDDN